MASQLSTTPSQVQQPSAASAPGGAITYQLDITPWLNAGETAVSPVTVLTDVTTGAVVSLGTNTPALSTVGTPPKQCVLQTIPNALLTAGHTYRMNVTVTVAVGKVPTSETTIVCPY
ncbi:MAG: hypothetical protein ACRENL_01845 [Candidatus Dormibacteria bacterium]